MRHLLVVLVSLVGVGCTHATVKQPVPLTDVQIAAATAHILVCRGETPKTISITRDDGGVSVQCISNELHRDLEAAYMKAYPEAPRD